MELKKLVKNSLHCDIYFCQRIYYYLCIFKIMNKDFYTVKVFFKKFINKLQFQYFL